VAYSLLGLGLITSILWVLALGWVASYVVPPIAAAFFSLL
jgi:hypothetical protein